MRAQLIPRPQGPWRSENVEVVIWEFADPPICLDWTITFALMRLLVLTVCSVLWARSASKVAGCQGESGQFLLSVVTVPRRLRLRHKVESCQLMFGSRMRFALHGREILILWHENRIKQWDEAKLSVGVLILKGVGRPYQSWRPFKKNSL